MERPGDCLGRASIHAFSSPTRTAEVIVKHWRGASCSTTPAVRIAWTKGSQDPWTFETYYCCDADIKEDTALYAITEQEVQCLPYPKLEREFRAFIEEIVNAWSSGT